MDRETRRDLIFDKHNHEWRFGRLKICWGYSDGFASFEGGLKFIWLKKSYERALEAEAQKMFPGIITMHKEQINAARTRTTS